MRPKNAKLAKAYLLPKSHKQFQHLPKFQPIIDTTGTTHYGVGKYLANLLNPLTTNEYTFRDSFDAAEKIRAIPKTLFDEGYVYVSFDVESLFTNVPLKRTNFEQNLQKTSSTNKVETTYIEKATYRYMRTNHILC